jgi:hypothetical protein
MFLPIEFTDEHGPYIEHLNVTHITRISFVNPRNPDAGSKIHLRTGEVLKTSMSFDILSQEIDEAWESASTLILTTVLSEKAKLMKKSDLLPEEMDELPPLTELD